MTNLHLGFSRYAAEQAQHLHCTAVSRMGLEQKDVPFGPGTLRVKLLDVLHDLCSQGGSSPEMLLWDKELRYRIRGSDM